MQILYMNYFNIAIIIPNSVWIKILNNLYRMIFYLRYERIFIMINDLGSPRIKLDMGVETMKQAKTILHNTFLLTGASLLMRLVQMVFQVYLSGKIGAAGIGLFQLISTVNVLAFTLGTAGIRVTVTCLIAEEMGKNSYAGVKQAVRCCLAYAAVLSVCAGLLLFYFSGFIANAWISDTRAVLSLKILAVSLPFAAMTSVVVGYFTASGKLGRYVVVELFERVVSIVATVFLLKAFSGRDMEYSCAAIIGGSSIATVVCFFLLYLLYARDRNHWPTVKSETNMFKRMITFALPLAVTEAVRSGLSTIENMLVPRGLRQSGDSGETALAQFGTISGMVMPVIMFPSTILLSIADLLIPELTECRTVDNQIRIKRIVNRVMQIGAIFAMGTTLIMYCLSDELGMLIYNSQDAAYFFRLFSPLIFILYLDIVVDGMNKGLNQQVANMRNNAITSILDIILLLLLLPRYGINGYFFAYATVRALNFFISMVLLIKTSDFTPHVPFIIKTCLCVAATLLVSWLTQGILSDMTGISHLLAHGAIVLGTYILCLLFTNALKRSDIKWILSLIKPNAPTEYRA